MRQLLHAPPFHPLRAFLLAGALPLVSVAALPVATSASCPVSELQFDNGPIVPHTESAFDTSGTDVHGIGEPPRLAYDTVAGMLRIHDEGKYPTRAVVRDRFTLSGVAAGTIVLVLLEVDATGTVATPFGCAGSACSAYLTVGVLSAGSNGAGTVGETVHVGSKPVRENIQVPIILVAGTPKEIGLVIEGVCAPDLDVTGLATYRFLGLPDGGSVTSCRGFVQGPTPAARASWGRIKAAYHR